MDQSKAFHRRYRAWIDRLELPTQQAEQAWRQISAQLFGTPSPEEGKRGAEQDGSKKLSDGSSDPGKAGGPGGNGKDL